MKIYRTQKFMTNLAAGSLLLMACGCSSTDVIEPAKPQDSGTIAVSVTAPEAYSFPSTRAHDGMKLRYTAKLFFVEKNNNNNKRFKARKELVPADANSNMFIFSADDQGDYLVKIFADYINDDAQPDENGNYLGVFYDTTSDDDYTEMLALHSKDGHTKYDQEFINNDNFDCFYGTHDLTKTANAYNGTEKLTRAVCKIRICASTGSSIYGIDNIKLTSISYLSQFSHINKGSGIQNNIDDECLPQPFKPIGGVDNELFWFYSFGSYGNKIGDISFELSGSEGWDFKSMKIPSGTIDNIVANKIYKVTGNFVQPINSPSNEIRITVENDESWGEESDKSVTVGS